METTFYFLVWAIMIFLMMRLGCGRHAMGQSHSKSTGHRTDITGSETKKDSLYWQAPTKDVDPVCGKTVATSQAKSSVFEGNVYYLCSHACREAFEAAPDIYISENPQADPAKVEHHYG